jgi:hypothetical protein
VSDHVDRLLEQWRRQRPDLDPAPMGVVGRIMRAARALEREIQATFATYDLQLGEFDVLATLRRAGPPYQLTAGALVATSMVTSGAMLPMDIAPDWLWPRWLHQQLDPDSEVFAIR